MTLGTVRASTGSRLGRQTVFLAASLLTAILLLGCNYKESKVAAGMGRLSGPSSGQPGSPTRGGTPTFAMLNARIFQPRCARCHKPGHRSGVVLTSYNEIMNSEGAVAPGDADHSDIYIDIRDGIMPKKAPRLSPEDIAAIYQWIQAGAKND